MELHLHLAELQLLSLGNVRGSAAVPARVSFTLPDEAWKEAEETPAIPTVGSFLSDAALNDTGSHA